MPTGISARPWSPSRRTGPPSAGLAAGGLGSHCHRSCLLYRSAWRCQQTHAPAPTRNGDGQQHQPIDGHIREPRRQDAPTDPAHPRFLGWPVFYSPAAAAAVSTIAFLRSHFGLAYRPTQNLWIHRLTDKDTGQRPAKCPLHYRGQQCAARGAVAPADLGSARRTGTAPAGWDDHVLQLSASVRGNPEATRSQLLSGV